MRDRSHLRRRMASDMLAIVATVAAFAFVLALMAVTI
jgi:hypothetical protein